MSTIFTSYPFLLEQPTQATHADSSLLKKTDTLFKSRHRIQEQKNIKDTSLFKKSISEYHKTFEVARKELYKWHNKRKERKTGRRYHPAFKQKVINEVHSGMRITQVAKSYRICYGTLKDWMKNASLPIETLPKIKEYQVGKRYPLEFKQKAVSEVCLGQHINQVCKNYNICQSSLSIWLKKAYSPNLPYNSSAAWSS